MLRGRALEPTYIQIVYYIRPSPQDGEGPDDRHARQSRKKSGKKYTGGVDGHTLFPHCPQPRRLWPLALLMPRREEGLRLMERQAVESEDPAAASQASTAPVWLFAATLFVSATLLFWIQPLFAKMVLPLLGGSPSVWNTAMVFFQAVLLAGYGYAHLLSRQCGQRSQIALHLGVLAVTALALPIGVAQGWRPDSSTPPSLWLLGLLGASIGAPFFAVSATAPLLQRWFSRTGHPHAHDPYFLYGASNLGSVLALLAFPVVLEPLLSGRAQAVAWTVGFAVLAVGIAGCGSLVWRRPVSVTAAPEIGLRPSRRQRVSWIVYAALPSSLLLSVTTHISTDIAPAPLLWVVPLTLYLLTFVIAFARRPPIPHWFAVRAMPLALMSLVAVFWWRQPIGLFLPLHLVVFFVITLMCHGELVRQRPGVESLTEFYLFVSLGGVIGGALTALGAPLLFNSVFEYPLSLALAAAVLPSPSRRAKRGDIILALLILAVLIGGQTLATSLEWPLRPFVVRCTCAAFALIVFALQARAFGFALCVGAILVGGSYALVSDETLWRGRSFFGVYRVTESADPPTRSLTHGTTIHGGQLMTASGDIGPTSYYTASSPVADVLSATQARDDRGQRVGVVGLGAGSLACYRRAGDDWRYFEIDPLVVWIAVESGYFDLMPRGAESIPIVLGDARLTLAEEPDGRLDVLILDAFSSDAIPMHLLTREAVALYINKLAADGVLVMHISNRFLDLEPVIARIVEQFGYAAQVAFRKKDEIDRETDATGTASHWVLIARHQATLDSLVLGEVWQPLETVPEGRVWSDDFSNLLEVIRWK